MQCTACVDGERRCANTESETVRRFKQFVPVEYQKALDRFMYRGGKMKLCVDKTSLDCCVLCSTHLKVALQGYLLLAAPYMYKGMRQANNVALGQLINSFLRLALPETDPETMRFITENLKGERKIGLPGT